MFGKPTRIYADAAAATPLLPQVRERLIELLDTYGNPGALHLEGVDAKRELEAARKEAADAIEAHPDEIIFTASGTEANNLAILGASLRGANILTTNIDHPSVTEPINKLEREGYSVTYLRVNEEGLLNLKELEEAITDTTNLVSIGLINSEIGVLQDIRAIAKIIRAKRNPRTNGVPLLLHIDASQAPLWLRLRMPALGCDLMTLDAQKIGGPKGVGLLFVARGVSLWPLILGGGQEKGLRSGTENLPLIGAFAQALTLAQQNAEENTKRIAPVRDELLNEIKFNLGDVIINGSLEHRVANNLNISIPGLIGERAVVALSSYGIAASTRSACANKDEELSFVIMNLKVDRERARGAIRFTLLPTATQKEMKIIAQSLKKAYELYKDGEVKLG